MKKIQIHGKDYVMVKDRIIFFNEHYPNGSIRTELIEITDRFIVKSTIIPDVDKPERYFTGHAEEVIGSSQINKTSALENAETSSLGRSLASMGIGVEDSFASADEVKNAQYKQAIPAYQKTENQREKFDKLISHACFDGKKKEVKDFWLKADSLSVTEGLLTKMNQKIQEYKRENNKESL